MLIQLKRGLSTSWATKNIVLSSGELGLETDTNKLKVGDGATSWNNLQYIAGDSIDDWVSGTSYAIGDVVVYQNKLYRCTTANNDSTWDSAKWQELGGGTSISDWEPSIVYSVGNYVRNNNVIYVCNTAHTSSSTFTSDKANWDSIKVEDMVGATSSANGKAGGVPAPTTSDINKFLCGDGTWKSVGGGGLNVGITSLWSGFTKSLGTLNLNDDITNYNKIIVRLTWQDDSSYMYDYMLGCIENKEFSFGFVEPSGANIGSSSLAFAYSLTFSGNQCTISSVTTPPSSQTWAPGICEIEGIKFYNSNSYSTTEQEIGTWVDGKKLYQKTFTGTFSSTASEVDVSSIGIDKVIDIDGIISVNDTFFPVNYYNSTNFFNASVGYNTIPSNKRILINADSGSTGTKEYFITIRYTKT